MAPGEDTYSPLQRESSICAPCHFGTFWGTVIYNSFGEWLDSPYSDPETGQTCQDCHMPQTGAVYFARPDQGGLRRDAPPFTSHRMPGAADELLLQNAVSMELTVERGDGSIVATVAITNDQTGHHVPTDSPLRHLILLVRAHDRNGRPLDRVEGRVVPNWGGVGSPDDGYYAGQPGKAFAKVLMEEWTQVVQRVPTGTTPGSSWTTASRLSVPTPAAIASWSGDQEAVRVSAELSFSTRIQRPHGPERLVRSRRDHGSGNGRAGAREATGGLSTRKEMETP